ncbi:MAG: type III secretion T3S chaperone [Verrucomicrobia bacterium]|nr:type III secretion T3S chaperone [Verrucomicrobiota bacterium]MBS0645643.1 type III secretion T3S chaperone [Verrucomicrobiota bacterium]
MTNKIQYPLQQILAVKKDRVEKAEKVVEEKKRALEVEQEKLKRVTAERDEIFRHKQDKLIQIREAFDKGTTSDKILQMKAYVKIVEGKLQQAEQKVAQQTQQVKQAEQALAAAKEDLRARRMEEEKIRIHKEEWEKEALKELEQQENKEYDEIGQLIHESQKRKKNN